MAIFLYNFFSILFSSALLGFFTLTIMARRIATNNQVLEESDLKGWYCAKQNVRFKEWTNSEGLGVREDGRIVVNLKKCDQKRTDINFLMPIPSDFVEKPDYPLRGLVWYETQHVQLSDQYSINDVKWEPNKWDPDALCIPSDVGSILTEIPVVCYQDTRDGEFITRNETENWADLHWNCTTYCHNDEPICSGHEPEFYPKKLSNSLNTRLDPSKTYAYAHMYEDATQLCNTRVQGGQPGQTRRGCPLGEGANVTNTFEEGYILLVYIDDVEGGQESLLEDCLGVNIGMTTTTALPIKKRWKMPAGGKVAGFLDQ